MKSGQLLFRPLPIASWLTVLALLVAVLVLGYASWRRSQTVTLTEPTGQFPVGRTTFDWTDDARIDPLSQKDNLKRELLVWVWYPAEPRPDATPAPYLPAEWGRLLDQQHGVLSQRFDMVRPHAVEDAPLSPALINYPVLILLPGFGSLPANYTSLAEDLASHGYIVAGVNPTGSAPVVVFADGRVAERTELGNLPDNADPATFRRRADDLVAVWAGDTRFTLDRLAALNAESDNPFAARLDLGRVGVLGHSLGGATAAEVCQEDSRFRAGADLDGTLFGLVARDGVEQPFLFLGEDEAAPCDADCRQGQADQQQVFDRLTAGYEITITGTRHFNFSDNAVFFEPIMNAMDLLGPIDGSRGLAVTSAYLRAFFDHELLGKEAPLLDGPSAAYPEVNLQRR